VPLVKGQGAEVRTLAIGEVQEHVQSDGTTQTQVSLPDTFFRREKGEKRREKEKEADERGDVPRC
jgi:hypothetical protein